MSSLRKAGMLAFVMFAVAMATEPGVDVTQTENGLWVLGAAIISAREFLEAVVIFSAYDTAVTRHFDENPDSEHTPRSYRTAMVISAVVAVIVAIAIVAGAGAGLASAGDVLDDKAVEIFEGVSKIVAAVCVGLLFLKIDKLMSKTKAVKLDSPLALGLTIFWNIVREMGEIGFFLVPYFLNKEASGSGLALSCIVGAIIGVAAGVSLIVYGRRGNTAESARLYFKRIALFLSAGLFMGGCHELEEAWGETDVFFTMDQKKFPMALFRPFGYTDKYTHLEFWMLVVALFTLVFLDKFNARRNAEKSTALPNNNADLELEADEVVVA